MKIINFYLFYNFDVILIFFAVLLAICSIKQFLDSLSSYSFGKIHNDRFYLIESLEKKELKFEFFVTLVIFLCCLFAILLILKNSKNTLTVEYINENVDENEINISKEQIINDILNGKITKNKNNLPVYFQTIQITKAEYENLSKYKEEYDKKIENGNVNILE